MVALQMSNKKRRRPPTPPHPSISVAEPPQTADLTLQECSFLHWDIAGITSIAAHPDSTLIAIARTNGVIELRSREHSFATISHIRSHSALEHSITALKFSPCGKYLIVARLDASLSILHISSEGLYPCTRLLPGGGAVWDLDVEPVVENGVFRIVAACDDGCVRVVRPDPQMVDAGGWPRDPAHYIVTASGTTSARVLSVAWMGAEEGDGGPYVVCGDAGGGLRWINVENGSVVARGKISSLRRQRAMIWTVQVVKGGREVLCGDSRGMITVWDAASATRVQEVQVEGVQGVVWSSVVTGKEGREVMVVGCAGGAVGGVRVVDEKRGKGGEWVPLRGTRLHSHDVRGMGSFAEGLVVTGSLDGRICVFSVGDLVGRRKVQWVLPYPGGLEQGVVQFCRDQGLVMGRTKGGLDVWSIPKGTERPALKLRMKLESFESEMISCALSANGRLLGVASWDEFRMYDIWDGVGEVDTSKTFGKVKSIEIEKNVEERLSGVEDMAFCGEKLVCVTRGGAGLAAVEKGLLTEWSLEMIGSKAKSLGRVTCGQSTVMVSDSRGEVFMATFEDSSEAETKGVVWRRVLSKPRGSHKVTAMAVSPSGKMVGIARSDLRVFIKNCMEKGVSERRTIANLRGVPTSLSFAGNEESLLVSGEKFCCICGVTQLTKKRKLEDLNSGKDDNERSYQTFYLRMKDSVLGTCVTGESRLVVVRRPWSMVQSSLPDAIVKKPFGT